MTDFNICPLCGQLEPPRDPNRPRQQEIWVLTRTIECEAPEQFRRAWVGKPTTDQVFEYVGLDAQSTEQLVHTGKVYMPSEDATYELFLQS